MKTTILFSTGILIGEIIDCLYDNKLNKHDPLHIVEHYHWGMILLMINNPLLNGLGVSMILDENRSECRFAIGKEHFIRSTIIGIILFIILMYRWI